MTFIIHQLQQLGMVILIMACAVGGTVGILKLIKKFFPNSNFLQNWFGSNQTTKQDHNNDD